MTSAGSPARTRATAGWAALGCAGSCLAAYAAPGAVHDSVVGWWYRPDHPHADAGLLVYVGMIALAVAWLGLGRRLPERRVLLAVAAAWMVPVALAPPLFSRDLYSYLAQGTILHLGRDPYHVAPTVLAGLGRGHVLAAVSPFWRHTTAPYGPLFLELVGGIAAVTHGHVIGGVLLTRALGLVGLGLLAVFVPVLARELGTDGRRALWLVVASPLAVLSLVGAGHNDALMAGMLAAGIAVALGGRPLTGVAICALAGTIKVPALLGAVFIAVAWARAEGDWAAAWRLLLASAAVALAVLAAVTLACGVGVGWLSSALFSTPAKVRLAITPGTAVGYTAAGILHGLGVGVRAHALEAAMSDVAFAVAAIGVVALLARVRVGRLVALLGAALWLVAAGGPAAWPWYFTWGVVLIAATRAGQRSRALVAALVVSAFLVKPNGVLALPLGSAPAVLAAYLLMAGGAWRWRRRRDGDGVPGPRRAPRADGRSPSALART